MYPSSMLMRYTPSEMSDAAYYFKYVFQAIEQNDLLGLKKIIRSSRAVMELADAYSNTPLLYACYRGRKDHLLYLLSKGANPHCINIFGQNALTLATYSGNLDTCQTIVKRFNLSDFNRSLLSPLCVAVLLRNTEIAKIYLSMEKPQNLYECASESIHGVCPFQLAQCNNDTIMMDLLRPNHQFHIPKMH